MPVEITGGWGGQGDGEEMRGNLCASCAHGAGITYKELGTLHGILDLFTFLV